MLTPLPPLPPPSSRFKIVSKVSGKIRIYETGLQLNASSISEFFTPDGVGVCVYSNSKFLHV